MALDEIYIIFNSSWSLVSIPTNTHGNVCSLCHLAIVTHIYILSLRLIGPCSQLPRPSMDLFTCWGWVWGSILSPISVKTHHSLGSPPLLQHHAGAGSCSSLAHKALGSFILKFCNVSGTSALPLPLAFPPPVQHRTETSTGKFTDFFFLSLSLTLILPHPIQSRSVGPLALQIFSFLFEEAHILCFVFFRAQAPNQKTQRFANKSHDF